MRTHHSLHITLISILQGEIARLRVKWDLKVESYHIARYLSADQLVTTIVFLGCNFVMELQKVNFFFLEGDV